MSVKERASIDFLVNYSSSSESDCDNEPQAIPSVTVEKLPIPNELSQFQKPQEVLDNPHLHKGRIRNFPHERGNWTTLIYIPLKQDLTRLFEIFKTELNKSKLFVEIIEDPHVSLTRTLVIPYHWIDPLVETIVTNVRHLSRFRFRFNTVEIFCNEEKSRTFLAIGVNQGKTEISNVLKVIDQSIQDFKLPIYYENPKFHASIGWCLNDQTKLLNIHHKKLNDILKDFQSNYFELSTDVTQLVMKTGNKVYSFPLS